MSEFITVWERNEPLMVGEKIVRCRDCANHTYTPKGSCRCNHWMTFVEPNGFCAWGERLS